MAYGVYILTNYKTTVLYIGVTNNLPKRVYEHKMNYVEGFSQKYKCHNLIYFEEYLNIHDAIAREKQIKKWRRDKKEMLINQANPEKRDLFKDIT